MADNPDRTAFDIAIPALEAEEAGAGVAGGIAGGALAGLACGPAAPICVTVGAFVDGAVAAFGASAIW